MRGKFVVGLGLLGGLVLYTHNPFSDAMRAMLMDLQLKANNLFVHDFHRGPFTGGEENPRPNHPWGFDYMVGRTRSKASIHAYDGHQH